MALINCAECGNQVSDKADKCPHCGLILKKSGGIIKYLAYFAITIFAVVILIITFLIFAVIFIPPI